MGKGKDSLFKIKAQRKYKFNRKKKPQDFTFRPYCILDLD